MIMSDFVPNSESVAPTTAPKQRLPSASIWLRELPYAAVLILTLLGVAYTSFTRRPMTGSDKVCNSYQPKNGQGTRSDCTARAARPRQRGHRMNGAMSAIGT